MANVPNKAIIIGLDCALPHLLQKHIADGYLPTIKKLIDGGVIADNCLVPYPTITPPNWASIATGAWPGTHGITDFHLHKPGTTPYNVNIFQSFSSEHCKAEYLWDAADKAGKKCIVLNYPGSWPSQMKKGIMVGGSGLSVGEKRDGLLGMAPRCNLCNDQMITTGIYPRAIHSSFQPASGWSNMPGKDNDPLELEAIVNFRGAEVKPEEAAWYVLAWQSVNNGYDRVTFSPTKDADDAFCTLAPGEWSPKITTQIRMKDGTQAEVFFRCKLVELSDDAENLRLYISPMGTTSGWSNPSTVAADIESADGILLPGGGILGYVVEWFDLDTFVEVNELYTQWLADAACSLMGKHEWDMVFMHAHSPDWAYHVILTEMDPDLNKNESKRKEAWNAHLKIYQAQDRMIEQILKMADKDALVILVSDHGAVPDGTVFDPYKILAPLGLAELDKNQINSLVPVTSRAEGLQEETRVGYQLPDPIKSKCFPQRTMYIYINLKGRDPEGIVEPEDYRNVQQQIIDALLTYVDPNTGKRPVSLALAKADARILGLYGDRVGDVIYALYPWYSGQHGNILPAAEWGIGSLKALLTFTGPGIKRGSHLERTCNLIDIVPTVCYLMDIPVPAQAEGAVLYQIFKNPNYKSEEIAKLKAGLARMEVALQRGERQPWDKHECA
jgi:predicted AlkP superfamily phosphohydrolase/phosphomutase